MDEAIELSVHQCIHNFKSTSIIMNNDLLKQVTLFYHSATGEVIKGCELDFIGRSDK